MHGTDWPLVGRQRELTAAGALLDDARRGVGGCLVVTAPAGAGKTFLLGQIGREAAGRGMEVRSATARAGLAAPFGLVTAAFGRPDDHVARPTEAPAVSSFFEAGVAGGVDAWMIERMIERVDELALVAPTVAVLDDLHLADVGSITFLDVLIERLASTPIGLVIGCRRAEPGHAVERWWSGLPSTATVIELGPLTDDAVRDLCTARFGAPPGPRLARSLASTGGSPLLAVTTLNAIADAGVTTVDGCVDIDERLERQVHDAVPDPVKSRLLSVVGADTVIAAAAAILGASFSAADVAAVVQAPLIDVVAVVSRLERAGVVVPAGAAHRFQHELFRRAAEESVSAPIRASLHRSYVDLLTARGESPLQIADHVVASQMTGSMVAGWLSRAAELLLRSDPGAALDLADRAIAVSGEPNRPAMLVRLRALTGIGRVADADALTRALLVDAAPDEEIVLRRELAVGLFREGRPDESIRELQRAAALEPDLGGRRRLVAEQAFMLLLAGDFDAARAMARSAADEVRAMGERRAGADVVTQLAAEMVGGLVTLYQLDVEGAADIADRLVSLAELPVASGAALYQPWFAASVIELELGHFAAARRINNIGRARSASAGYFWAVPGYDTLDAAAHFQEGSLDDAEAAASAALAAGVTDAYGANLWCHALLARCAIERNQWPLAAERVAVAASHVRPTQAQLGLDHLAMAEAAVLEAEGRVADALERVAAYWDAFEAWRIDMPRQELSLDLARLAALHGDRDRAEQVLAHLAGVAAATGRERFRLDHELARWSIDAVARTEDDLDRRRDDLARAYRALGHELRVRRLERPAGRGRAPRSVSAGPAVSPLGLSRSEWAVAELLAQGLTNTEIAARLFISRRTVESHVSATYRKLGVANRVELARRVDAVDDR